MINRRQFLLNGFGVVSGFYIASPVDILTAVREKNSLNLVPGETPVSADLFDMDLMISREIEVGMREQALGRDPNVAIFTMRQQIARGFEDT